MTVAAPSLGDRLRRVATWADAVPETHFCHGAVAIDRLAIELAHLAAGHADDPLVALLADDTSTPKKGTT